MSCGFNVIISLYIRYSRIASEGAFYLNSMLMLLRSAGIAIYKTVGERRIISPREICKIASTLEIKVFIKMLSVYSLQLFI